MYLKNEAQVLAVGPVCFVLSERSIFLIPSIPHFSDTTVCCKGLFSCRLYTLV